mgnify:CR=1 FL=1|tara:strand:- start:187 stop:1164 length:978 start_codon:yes stop_codon:yes gene_type:complete
MKNEQNELNIFYCKCCHYKCFKKSNFNRHLLTAKHQKLENTITINQNEQLKLKKEQKPLEVKKEEAIKQEILLGDFKCECGKAYKHYPSLWTHKKNCTFIEDTQIVEKPEGSNDYKDMILELVKENKEMRTMMVEQQKTIGELIPKVGNNNSTTNNNNNTINQKFNINVFLNEQCKDAINMSDFIKQIEISLEQLDFTKTNGLEKGLTQAIMDNMNKLSVYERPMHCTDVKRETLYIKDNDTWEKDRDKSKIKQVIKKASNKNYTALTNWTKANPKFMEDDSKQMFYAKAMSKIGKPLDGIDDKVIKNLCNNTQIKEIKDDLKDE